MGKFHFVAPRTMTSTGLYTRLDDNPLTGFVDSLAVDSNNISKFEAESWRDNVLVSKDVNHKGIEPSSDILRLLEADTDTTSAIERRDMKSSKTPGKFQRTLRGGKAILKNISVSTRNLTKDLVGRTNGSGGHRIVGISGDEVVLMPSKDSVYTTEEETEESPEASEEKKTISFAKTTTAAKAFRKMRANLPLYYCSKTSKRHFDNDMVSPSLSFPPAEYERAALGVPVSFSL